MYMGYAVRLTVSVLTIERAGWDIILRKQYTIGGWIEYLLASVAFALIIIDSISYTMIASRKLGSLFKAGRVVFA